MIRKMLILNILQEAIEKNTKIDRDQIETTKSYLKELEVEYDKGTPIITDEEYDELRNAYLDYMSKQEETFTEEMPAVEEITHKVTHSNKVLSLDKINTSERLEEEIERLYPCLAEVKYDGITLVGYPDEEGFFIGGTRGTGEVGENITAALRKSGIFNNIYFDKIGFPFRGEIYLKKSNFVKVNEVRTKAGKEPFENTRNAVAGMIKKGNEDELQYLSFVAYNLIGADQYPLLSQLKHLKSVGFDISNSEVLKAIDHTKVSKEDGIQAIKEWVLDFEDKREDLDFDIDGMVIKNIEAESIEKFGLTAHHPKNAVAFKFKSKGAWTTLREVVWTTGKTGRLAPVGVIDPIKVAGSTIRNVTLNNYGYITKNGIALNKDVYIIKSNDVIPKLTQVKDNKGATPITEPTSCPICGGVVTRDGDLHFCQNTACKGKLAGIILHYAKKEALSIDGLAEGTIDKMVASGKITYPIDIFKLELQDILELDGFAQKSAEKLLKSIQEARNNVKLESFLYASCVPLLGRTASSAIVEKLDTFAKFVNDVKIGCPTIKSIDGLGDGLVENLFKYQNMIGMLRTVVVPMGAVKEVKVAPAGGDQFVFCFTGKLPFPRGHYEALVGKKGHIFKDSMTKAVNYLVIGDKVGAAKITKAEKQGTKVINLAEFEELIGA